MPDDTDRFMNWFHAQQVPPLISVERAMELDPAIYFAPPESLRALNERIRDVLWYGIDGSGRAYRCEYESEDGPHW